MRACIYVCVCVSHLVGVRDASHGPLRPHIVRQHTRVVRCAAKHIGSTRVALIATSTRGCEGAGVDDAGMLGVFADSGALVCVPHTHSLVSGARGDVVGVRPR